MIPVPINTYNSTLRCTPPVHIPCKSNLCNQSNITKQDLIYCGKDTIWYPFTLHHIQFYYLYNVDGKIADNYKDKIKNISRMFVGCLRLGVVASCSVPAFVALFVK